MAKSEQAGEPSAQTRADESANRVSSDAAHRNSTKRHDGPAEALPSSGRLAGIDFGTVRIGLATCDPSQHWVTPFDTYSRRNEKLDASFFVDFARQDGLVGWVIGLPIHCDGKESQKSQEARSFGAWLTRVTQVPHLFFDERFTTREARRLLQDTGLSSTQKKKRLDRLAAHLILTHYLEWHKNAPPQEGGAPGPSDTGPADEMPQHGDAHIRHSGSSEPSASQNKALED